MEPVEARLYRHVYPPNQQCDIAFAYLVTSAGVPKLRIALSASCGAQTAVRTGVLPSSLKVAEVCRILTAQSFRHSTGQVASTSYSGDSNSSIHLL